MFFAESNVIFIAWWKIILHEGEVQYNLSESNAMILYKDTLGYPLVIGIKYDCYYMMKNNIAWGREVQYNLSENNEMILYKDTIGYPLVIGISYIYQSEE